MLFITALGWFLVLLAFADIFFTVLFPSKTGIFSPLIGKGGWSFFRFTSKLFGPYRRYILSISGPLLILITAATWSLVLALGFALVFWPDLGLALQKSKGPTPTGFLSALYYSGFSLTTLGIGDIVPKTNHTRLLTILEAGLGFSFFTLTITYIISIYSALQRRNTLSSVLDHVTAGRGNAAVFIIDIGSAPDICRNDQALRDFAYRTADLVESHKFYPVLHYFHFLQIRYSIARMILILMDTATLLETLPFPGRDNLRGPKTQLFTAGKNLLDELSKTFKPKQPSDGHTPSEETKGHWRDHFRSTAQALKKNGVDIPDDLAQEEERYVALRSEWHPQVADFATSLGYPMDEVLANQSGN